MKQSKSVTDRQRMSRSPLAWKRAIAIFMRLADIGIPLDVSGRAFSTDVDFREAAEAGNFEGAKKIVESIREESSPGNSRDRRKNLLVQKAAYLKGMIRRFESGKKHLEQGRESGSFNEIIERSIDDTQKEIDELRRQLNETEFLLHPPKGRSPEAIYSQALRDLDALPTTPIRQLAEKYFPHYFPTRADSAVKMMTEGLRRARKKKHPAEK